MLAPFPKALAKNLAREPSIIGSNGSLPARAVWKPMLSDEKKQISFYKIASRTISVPRKIGADIARERALSLSVDDDRAMSSAKPMTF